MECLRNVVRLVADAAAISSDGPVWRLSDFHKLWAAQSVSVLGTAVTIFALPTLAILVLHASPAQVGITNALETLPFPILGVFVGVLADRWPRRTIMIVADLGRFAFLASIPICAYFGVLSMAQLYVVALGTGICSAFFGITYQSYLPVIVAKDRLTDANVKLETSNSAATMSGGAVAGVLVQLVGAAASIGFDALSYVVSVVLLSRIRTSEAAHDGPALSPRQTLREIIEGVRTVVDTPNLRWIAAATATSNLGGSIVAAVTLIYAYRVLHLEPGWLGVVSGIAEIGFVGALLSTRIRRSFGLRATLFGALLAAALGNTCMLLAQVGFPYLALLGAAAIAAVAIPIYNVNQLSYRQGLVDLRLQGRLNATMRTFVWGTLPLGSLIGGYLASAIGAPRTILVGAVIVGLSALWLLPVHERVAT